MDTAYGPRRAAGHPPTHPDSASSKWDNGHDGLLFGIREVQAAFHAAAFQQGPE